MDNPEIKKKFNELSTSLIADASVKLHIPIRLAPSSIIPLIDDTKIAGNLVSVQHTGSISSIFEVLSSSMPGDVLYIDNQGRSDEAVFGDLTVLEVQQAGLSGIIVWGLHRDTSAIRKLGFPVFSTGQLPVGPRRSENITEEKINIYLGDFEVNSSDIVFADEDGIIIISNSDIKLVLDEASKISAIEQKQAEKLHNGISLRKQLHFSDFLLVKKRKKNYSFSDYTRLIGAGIEQS